MIHKQQGLPLPVSPTAKPVRKAPRGPAGSATAIGRKSRGFTDEAKAAMKEYLQERQGVHPKAGADAESAVLAKIAKMKDPDRATAKRVHEIMKANAPGLSPRTWYGMPAYADKDGKVVCFFQPAQKFKTRYATLGFTDRAKLDEGAFWSVAFAVKERTAADEA